MPTSRRLGSFAQNWQKEAVKEKPDVKKAKSWRSKTQADFNTFVKELEKQIKAGSLDEQAIREIVSLRNQINEIL